MYEQVHKCFATLSSSYLYLPSLLSPISTYFNESKTIGRRGVGFNTA